MYLPMPFKKMKRGPQVILPKDIGMIIAYSNITKDSICVDAGTGSGWLACALARISKQVVSYELREDFVNIAEYNKKMLNLTNLEIKIGDFRKAKEKNVDLVTLDLPEAHKMVHTALKILKPGGVIVAYLPHTEQVGKFIKKLISENITNYITFEVIARDILVRDAGIRPSTKGIWHTAYIVFATNLIQQAEIVA
ncbi:MAG: methyltransferase domain-containing protein [Candidatus Micrarchaeaceae archaeon]